MKLTISGVIELRRADEIALVLAILVVGDDDELAVADRLDRLFYRSETMMDSLSKRCTYLPSMSASTCTRSPAASVAERGVPQRIVDQRQLQRPGSRKVVHREAHAVHRHRPVRYHKLGEPGRAEQGRRGARRRAARPSRPRQPRPRGLGRNVRPAGRRRAAPARGSRGAPALHVPIVVRSSVSSRRPTVNHPAPCSRTVRHAPFTAMLSPATSSAYRHSMRNSRPASVDRDARDSPTSSISPVNTRPRGARR